jgi:hypothetical protein
LYAGDLLPHEHHASALTDISSISIKMADEPSQLKVDMKPDGGGGTNIRIVILPAEPAMVSIVLPSELWDQVPDLSTDDVKGDGARGYAKLLDGMVQNLEDEQKGIVAPHSCAPSNADHPTCAIVLGDKVVTLSTSNGLFSIDVPSSDSGYGVSTNHEYATVLLPPIEVENRDGDPVATSPATVTYGVKDARSYTWADSVQPHISESNATWAEQTGAALSPTEEQGTRLNVQDQDAQATFVAGALLGIFGAAFVAGVTELAGWSRRRSRARQS